MTATSKQEAAPSAEVERLGLALVTRGLITRDELQQCKSGEGGPERLLERLVKAGFLTATQARRLGPELPQLVNQMIPGYELLDKLGQGAMGTVFKARQVSMNRFVALKVLSPRLAANREFLQRFVQEAHLAARLSSNNVVQAIDVGSAGNLHYFVMEYVEGTTLHDELDRGKVFPEREAVEIVVQIAQALQHAHRRGLVHRDIKPANIMVTKDGIAKLADLGLARERTNRQQAQAEKGMTFGTPFYIAPEQIEGRTDIDSRADIYSLGATFYHLVTGRPPFPGKNVEKVFDAHLKEPLEPPDEINPALSRGLSEVVSMMMAKDRRRRYRTPDELFIDLERLLNGETPPIAGKHLDMSALAELEKSAAEELPDEELEEEVAFWERPVPLWWLIAGGGLLAFSILINLALLLR